MTVHRLPAGFEALAEIEIRRSRFIALARRARTDAEARALVAEARDRWPGARHYCSAFVHSVPGANRVERSSDDGEPAGTAGMPMLETLRGSGLDDTAVVVVRYFGGVKLGTGGLARAYSDAVSAALGDAPRVRVETLGLVAVEVSHQDAGRIEADLRAHGVVVHDVDYGAAVTMTFATRDTHALAGRLAALTGGTAAPVDVGSTEVELPV